MESSKSLEQEGLLSISSVVQALDGLDSLGSTVLDSLGGMAEASLTVLVLEDFVILMI